METAAWAGAIATFLAVIVALFKEDIEERLFVWRHPKLVLRCRRGAPDWARTPIFAVVRYKLPSGEEEQQLRRFESAYYFRIWVENEGEQLAEGVQVYAANLSKRQADSSFQPVRGFLPMNLRWAHSADPAEPELFDDINPRMGRHCDLGRICGPAHKADLGDELPGVEPGSTVFHLELEVKPASLTHLLPPGFYRLELRIAAANARPITRFLDINHTGRWFAEEDKMFDEGIGIAEPRR